MIEALVGAILGAIVSALGRGILKSIHDAIWWDGAIKGGLFVLVSVLALMFLYGGRKS